MRTNELSDRVIEVFLWIWELFYCVIALPLALGLCWLVVGAMSEILDVVYIKAFKYPYFYYGISAIVGVGLKIWLTNRRKKTISDER